MTGTDEYPIVNDFKLFISNVKLYKLSNPQFEQSVDDLKNNSSKFFEIFSDPDIKDAINNDLSSFFEKIKGYIESLSQDAKYIFDIKDESAARNQIVSIFQNDIIDFFQILSYFASFQTSILEEIKQYKTNGMKDRVIQRKTKQFLFEIVIFNYSYNIISLDKPPYYKISSIPCYKYIHSNINSTENKFINVNGPNGTGKTKLVPLFFVGRSLGFKIYSRFIILIENDAKSIPDIETTYNKIIKNNEYFQKDTIIITSSSDTFYEKSKDNVNKPVIISILTPIDALQLIRKYNLISFNDIDFLRKSTFIIDDVNERKVETDVLAQDILENVFNEKLINDICKLVLIGNYSDERFLNIFDTHVDILEIPTKNDKIQINEIECGNYFEVGKISIFNEMARFLDSWTCKKQIDIGSIITLVPNVKIGRTIYKHLFKKYKESSLDVFLIDTKIMKGESLQSLYKRILDDIDKTINEKALKPKEIGKTIIFVYPLELTGYLNDEEINFINSNLPLPFITKNFVRLIITTNKNERLLKVPDTTVVFDSGLTEVEYYEPRKYASSFKLEELDPSLFNQRNILLNNQKKSAHFKFNVNDPNGKRTTLPMVLRSNLDQSILLLRKINIEFEKQRNLPNEPLTKNVNGAMEELKKNLKFIDKKGNLTKIGKNTSKFSAVSPNFALATTLYEQNHEFAFLISLIIERSFDLIENSQTPLLCNNFCKDSDVVTIIESIYELNNNNNKNEKSGFSINTLESIYLTMASTFEKVNKEEGKKAVMNSIEWARKQKGGILKCVDDFVDKLNKDNFIKIRKATFAYLCGVGAGSDPTIVYNANDALKFNEDEESLVKFSKRPGWMGLQAPGNIIILSFQIEESVRLNRGILLHHDTSIEAKERNIGIVSQNVESYLNSCFFITLFEAYWDNTNNENKLTPIYHSYKPKNETAFLIHINENNKKTFINFCPKSSHILNEMSKTISFCSALMPFLPRSVILKCDVPSCVVELLTYGTGQNYDTHVYLIDNEKLPRPLAYQVDRDILVYAKENINELRKTHPKIRFSITGESFYYKINKNKQVEADFSYPTVDPTIQSVFDPLKSSHLVLLVDNDFPRKPADIDPIPWTIKAPKSSIKSKDNEEMDLILDVSKKIMNGLGNVEKINDVFFITLNGGFPTVVDGEIPEEIQVQVGFKNGQITGGIHDLIRQFEKNFIKKDNINEQVTLKKIVSTNHCKKYTKLDLQKSIIDQINNETKSKFGLKDIVVKSYFLGNSMICINIFNLPSNYTLHPPSENMFDDSYKPCKADSILKGILTKLSVPVTTIIHEPSIKISVQYIPRFRISQGDFNEKTMKISSKFGFLCNAVNVKDGIQINLIGKNSCIPCASLISNYLYGLESGIGITMTMAMDASSTMKTLSSLDPKLKKPLKIKPVKNIIRVPQCEIEAMKDLVKVKTNWQFDEDYRILIFPYRDSEEARKMLLHVREENNIACFFSCGMDEPELLPQCIFASQKDGSVKTFGICKHCAIALIQNFEDVQNVYNPATHLLDPEKLAEIKHPIPGLGFIEEERDSDGNYWPQIPIGQILWALLSDGNGTLSSYVKAWFTILVEFTIQTCGLFIYCPDHRKFPILRPDKNETVKCSVCDMIYCKDCDSWHSMGAECNEGLPNVKRCPNCHCPGEKYTGCDHIRCPRCGIDWNYATGKRMNC